MLLGGQWGRGAAGREGCSAPVSPLCCGPVLLVRFAWSRGRPSQGFAVSLTVLSGGRGFLGPAVQREVFAWILNMLLLLGRTSTPQMLHYFVTSLFFIFAWQPAGLCPRLQPQPTSGFALFPAARNYPGCSSSLYEWAEVVEDCCGNVVPGVVRGTWHLSPGAMARGSQAAVQSLSDPQCSSLTQQRGRGKKVFCLCQAE